MITHRSSRLLQGGVLFLGSLVACAGAKGQSIEQVFAFSCNSHSCADGASPTALIQGKGGNLYGTASLGQENAAGGTIFKLTPSGQFTLLFSFSPGSQSKFPNGEFPSSLVQGRDGFLYGTSEGGGAHGRGAFFKISMAGMGFKVLHSFCVEKDCADGALPTAIALGPDGNFYGTSAQGGITTFCTSGCGTVFRITPAGSFTLIHAINGSSDGNTPSRLTLASDGNFYGLTLAPGLLFRVSTSGLYTAMGALAFANPNTVIQSGLAEENGKLYGVACHYLLRQHVMFEINLDGSNLQTLASFEPCIAELPFASVLSVSDSNLWVGSVPDPSALPAGLTALSPESGLAVQRFAFDGANGAGPVNTLIQANDGTLYGTTSAGGTVPSGVASGVVFRLADGPPPLP